MEIKKFEDEFVERTKTLLTDYKGPWDVSNLINCTLGLIILPYENIKRTASKSVWSLELNMIPGLPTFQLHIFEPIRSKKENKITYYPKTLKVLLQKIRNGLAHQNIEPINQDGRFTAVVIRNYFDDHRIHKDLEVQFSKEELRCFALFIAEEYLK